MPFTRLKAAVEEGWSYLLPEMSSHSTTVPVSPEDTVWLLDTTAFPTPADDNGKDQTPLAFDRDATNATWTAEFVACLFAQDKFRTKAGKWIAQIAQELNLAPDDEAARRTIETRVQPFLADILPSKQLSVRINGDEQRDERTGEVLKLERSDRNGISSSRRSFNRPVAVGEPGAKLKCVAITEPGDTRDIEMDVFCASAGGWGIISDIDDTIKVSQVRDRAALLRNTFVNSPEPTPGFPEFYQTLQARLNSPTYLYLSASPYNLYPFLRSFVRKNYPHGQIILRDMSWMDLSSFVVNLSEGTQDYKVDRMKKVHGWLPRKRWVAIGDSTQTDPESYAEIYKTYPGWIQRIWIRTVRGVDPEKEKHLNSAKRLEKAFAGVPKEAWKTFDDVEELYAELNKIEV